MKLYPLLSRVKMTIVSDGVIQTKMGEIVGRTMPGEQSDLTPFYDVLVAGEMYANVKSSEVEFVDYAVRIIDYPYEPSNRTGQPVHVGCAA